MKVTIIMACYNAEAYIDKAINSIIEQSIGLNNIEVIMVDDHSKDGTYKIAEAYTKKYGNFSLYSTEFTSGSCATPRNVALKYVKTPYVMFLDPDDYLGKDACEVLCAKIEEYDADIVKGACQINGVKEQFVQEDLVLEDINEIIKLPIIHTCANLYKLDLIKRHDIFFPDGLIYEDNVFYYKYLLNTRRIVTIPNVVHFYEQRSGGDHISVTKKTDFRGLDNLCSIYSMVVNLFKPDKTELFRKIFDEIKNELFFKIMITDELTKEQEKQISSKLEWLNDYVDKTDLMLEFGLELINRSEINLFKKYFTLINDITGQIANPDVKTVERKAEEYIRSGDLSGKKLLKLILDKRKK